MTATLDSLPPLGVGLLAVGISSIVIEGGYQFGKRIGGERGLSKHPVEATVTTAILGLLAFMLGFSFATAAARYGKQRGNALADANIAGTLYLRADFLPPELIGPAKDLIREDVQIRLDAVESGSVERIAEAVERSREIQSELWTDVVQARRHSDNISLNLFITRLNELIDNDMTRRRTAFSNRLPAMLWYSLAFVAVLAISMLGVGSGLHGRRSRLATTALVVAFALVFVLIVDLDRPMHSLFKRGDPAAAQALESMQG